MKIALNIALAVAALISTSAVTVSAEKSRPLKRAAAGAHWSYGQGNAGPQHWGQLDPLYGTCGTGKKQSPIDITVGAPFVHLQNQTFSGLHYPPIHDALCGYDGHAVKCEFQAPVQNSITIQNKVYMLINFHFHSPSEHRIDNHFGDAELHFVHQASDKSLAVVGLLLEVQSKNNPFFQWIVALDKKVDRAQGGHGFLIKDKVTGEVISGKEQIKYKVEKIEFDQLLRSTGKFTPRWEYEGSLTTPPCTEGVAWNVVKQSVGLGLEQFDALVDLEAFNSRFIQDRAPKTKH